VKKIIGKLVQAGVAVVETPAEADGQLTGIGVVKTGHRYNWVIEHTEVPAMGA
jgi:hypothetical protein